MTLAKAFSQNKPFLTKQTTTKSHTWLWLMDVWWVLPLFLFPPFLLMEMCNKGLSPGSGLSHSQLHKAGGKGRPWHPKFPELRTKTVLSVCICLRGQWLLLTHRARGCFCLLQSWLCGSCDAFSCIHSGFFISVSFDYSPLNLSDQIRFQLVMNCQWQITAFCFQQCLSLLASIWKSNTINQM